jgi:hypothetical protein
VLEAGAVTQSEWQAMGSDETYQRICDQVCGMDRHAVMEDLLHFPGDLHLDFPEEYLEGCSTEKIQHLLVAAMWRNFVKQLSTGVAAHA